MGTFYVLRSELLFCGLKSTGQGRLPYISWAFNKSLLMRELKVGLKKGLLYCKGCLLMKKVVSGPGHRAKDEKGDKDEDGTSPALLVLMLSKGRKSCITVCSQGSQKGTSSAYSWEMSGMTRPIGTFQSMSDRNKKISPILHVLVSLNTFFSYSLLKNSQC